MQNSNPMQGTDLASILSMLHGGQQSGIAQAMQMQQMSDQLQCQDASTAQMNATSESAVMSTFLQSLTGALNQQQRQPQTSNTNNSLMAFLASQQLGQMGGGGTGLDLARLAGSGLFGNSQTAGFGDQQYAKQALDLASLLNIQHGNHAGQNQDQALALARLAGARLLTGDGFRNEQQDGLSLSRNDAVVADSNPSSLISQRNNESEQAARGNRNLEPGAIAVPCRARGMPMDHNPLTAYFVISKNIQHGEDVVCAHPACRNAGVKFRYCSFCKAPVAKRNFRRRHNHGSGLSAMDQDEHDDESPQVLPVRATSSPRPISTNDGEPEAKRAKSIPSGGDDVDAATNHSKFSVDKGESAPQAEVAQPGGVGVDTLKDSGAQPGNGDADPAITITNCNGKSISKPISQERREEWAKLLDERPISNDAESMSRWIDKILKVSDAGQRAKSTFNDAIHQGKASK